MVIVEIIAAGKCYQNRFSLSVDTSPDESDSYTTHVTVTSTRGTVPCYLRVVSC